MRRNYSLRRASNYTLSLAVVFGLGGVALEVFPEGEKLQRLREEVAVLEKEREEKRWVKNDLKQSVDLLENGDLDSLETEARKTIRNLQAPDERILRITRPMNDRFNRLDEPGERVKDEEDGARTP
ncbi:MAG TPA: hypothetical protein VMN36_18500 [Verrucomicrobiales bacterium]|nr:hypothetical protein [Verrucomicrobiales bacterium]